MTEEQVIKALLQYLTDNGSYIVCFDFSQSGTGRVLHPNNADGGKKPTICVKHTIIIRQDKQGNFIGEDEAHFICGIINSEIVQQYIHSSFKSNGHSLNKVNIYIPKFNKANKHHKKDSNVSKKEATEDVDIKEIQHQLMKEYIAICP